MTVIRCGSLIACLPLLSGVSALPVHRIECGARRSLSAVSSGGAGGLRMAGSPPSRTSPSWSDLTVSQLKSQLRERELPVSGIKAELVKRLEEHEDLTTAETSSDARTQRQAHEQGHEEVAAGQSNGGKRPISFPPPKDDTEIQVMEKEVQETVQMLEGLKLGGGGGSGASDESSRQKNLSRQQRKQQELMDSLKRSLRETASRKSSVKRENTEPAALTPETSAREERLRHYVEQLRLKPANILKEELSSLRLSTKGRKPDLVNRLAGHYVDSEDNDDDDDGDNYDFVDVKMPSFDQSPSLDLDAPASFAGIPRLSAAADAALGRAFGVQPEPSPIQSAAISKLFYPPNPSALLHAPTGSGKTIAYLLPITETLWREVERSDERGDADCDEMASGMALVLLPTRELAAQVAGVATVLAPPGMARLVSQPTDLMRFWKDVEDRGEEIAYREKGGVIDDDRSTGRRYLPRLLIGSAKSVSASLFGDAKTPGSPTNKPKGKELLGSVRWLVLDEVDRLLNVKKSRTDKKSRHERPAALLAAATARLTLGRAQVIAASATVGRPLRRELARVLGLHPSECPETVRGEDDEARLEGKIGNKEEKHVGRAVRIPPSVRNYVLPVDGSTAGSLLTSASFACKSILQPAANSEAASGRRVLLVLTRNCDIQVHNALGALRHFGIKPEPRSLLDALEADGADRLVEAHRRVSGVEGVGGTAGRQGDSRRDALDEEGGEGYLLVTHEDNVRGLHLDGLDAVVVAGRPAGPDEYTHIAGRTGRAGRRGSVLNVVSYEQAAALSSWAMMLGVDFFPVDEGEVVGIVDDPR